MPRDTDVADRTRQFEDAFAEQPRAELPAVVQQQIMDERPRGAISVAVKRDELEVLRKIKVIASAAGDDFFYSWPTKNKDGTKGVVEGPSVKCANAVARIFGNNQVRVRAFDMGPHWIFYAQFYDMESGFVYERPFQQRKGQNIGGKMDADRALDIVFQIGASKAARNAVCNALSEFTDYAFAVAKEQLVEKVGKNLPKFLQQVKDRLVELKVDIGRVEQIRGKPADKWLAADLAKIIAEIQACNDGMAHPDELWPPAEAQAGAPRPQEADFKPEGDKGPAKPAETPGPASPAADKPAASDAPVQADPKTDSPPAAASEAVVAESVPPAESAPAATSESVAAAEVPQGEEAGRSAQADGDGPTAAEKAMEAAEAVLQRGIDNLGNLRTPEAIDEAAPTIVDVLKEIEDLDPEDLALLQNRWKTAQLERKRDMARKPKGRR